MHVLSGKGSIIREECTVWTEGRCKGIHEDCIYGDQVGAFFLPVVLTFITSALNCEPCLPPSLECPAL
jgi:hypothetical protein